MDLNCQKFEDSLFPCCIELIELFWSSPDTAGTRSWKKQVPASFTFIAAMNGGWESFSVLYWRRRNFVWLTIKLLKPCLPYEFVNLLKHREFFFTLLQVGSDLCSIEIFGKLQHSFKKYVFHFSLLDHFYNWTHRLEAVDSCQYALLSARQLPDSFPSMNLIAYLLNSLITNRSSTVSECPLCWYYSPYLSCRNQYTLRISCLLAPKYYNKIMLEQSLSSNHPLRC